VTTATKKRLAWWMMSAGFGAALFFGFIIVIHGSAPSAREWFFYLWPAAGIGIGIASLRWMRRLYRLELLTPPAAFHLALTDIIIATLFSAATAGAAQALIVENHELLIPIFGIAGFLFYIHGALAASLRGASHNYHRPIYVVSHILLNLCYLGLTSLALVISLEVIGEGLSLLYLLERIINGGQTVEPVFRLCILAGIPGIVLHLLWRTLERRSAKTINAANPNNNSIK
jgi:hypothetical protein